MANLYLDIHGYAKIKIVDPPIGLRQYLVSEYPIFVHDDFHYQDKNDAIQAIVRFVDKTFFANEQGRIYFGPYLGYADRQRGLFCYTDKYGAPSCLDVQKSLPNQWHLFVSSQIIPSNFVEIIIRGWLLRYHLLQNQVAFVHASAVSWRGNGVLFSAWGGTGKTNLVFKFMENGASYMGDDLALITQAGDLLAFPERVNIFDYNFKNLQYLPTLKHHVPAKSKILFGIKHLYEGFYQKAETRLSLNSGSRAVLRRVKDLTYSLGAFPINITDIFPQSQVQHQQRLSHVLHLFRSRDTHIRIEKVHNKKHLATQMAACLEYEHHYCNHLYGAFLFAYPEYRSETVENILTIQQSIIENALSNAKCWYVYVPVDMPASHLFARVQEILDEASTP